MVVRLGQYHCIQKDRRTELHFARIIFWDCRAAMTEPSSFWISWIWQSYWQDSRYKRCQMQPDLLSNLTYQQIWHWANLAGHWGAPYCQESFFLHWWIARGIVHGRLSSSLPDLDRPRSIVLIIRRFCGGGGRKLMKRAAKMQSERLLPVLWSSLRITQDVTEMSWCVYWAHPGHRSFSFITLCNFYALLAEYQNRCLGWVKGNWVTREPF